MEVRIKDGDYIPDGLGGVVRCQGRFTSQIISLTRPAALFLGIPAVPSAVCALAHPARERDGSIVIKGNGSVTGNWVVEGDIELTGGLKVPMVVTPISAAVPSRSVRWRAAIVFDNHIPLTSH